MKMRAPVATGLSATPGCPPLEQDEALQRDALKAAGCDRLFVEKSGKLGPRHALEAMLEQVRPGDTVVVWRQDRLGRSLRHLNSFADFSNRGVAFRSLNEDIDPESAVRMQLHVLRDYRRSAG